MGERVKLRAMWIKEDSKGSPKWPNIGKFRGPNRSTKEAKTRSSRSGRPGGTEPTTVCPWRTPRTVVGGTHDHAQTRTAVRPCCLVFFVFHATFRLPAVFSATLPYIVDAPRHSKQPNTLHSHPLSFPRVLELVLERERGSGEDLQGFYTGFDREIQERVWAELFFPFSSLCSI